MSNRVIKAGLALYAAAAIITFGHAAAYADRVHAACEAKPLPDKSIRWCEDSAPISGILAGALWPLYWSWEAWS